MRNTVTRETVELSSWWWFTLRVRPAPTHRHTQRRRLAQTLSHARTCALFNFTVYNFAVRLPVLCAQPSLALGENSIGRVKRTRVLYQCSFLGLCTKWTKNPLEDIGTTGRTRVSIESQSAFRPFPMEDIGNMFLWSYIRYHLSFY